MKLKIGDNEYAIKPISLGDYLELKDKDLSTMKDIDLLIRFTTAPESEVVKIPFAKIGFIASIIKSSFGADDDAAPLSLTLKVKDKWYGLIRPSEMTYEEWINLEVFMSEKPLDILKMATHLYKPLKNEKMGEERELIDYDLNECKSREEDFMEMSMGDFTSALFFLTTFAEKLTQSLLDYTEMKLKDRQKQMKK